MADRILIVDDEKIIRESIAFILKKEGFVVGEAVNGKLAHEKLQNEPFDLVISDLEMPEMNGIELLDKVMQLNPQSLMIIITAFGSLDTAISALRKGASDYILKPVEFDELMVKVRRLLDHRHLLLENQLLRRELQQEFDFSNLVGQSPSMQRVFEMIRTVAPTDGTVLITGKSGTGKELVARAIHFNSRRAEKPLIAVNCGAISETLFESELFGHKKGSFTGAISDKAGYFKAADTGTLLLDEISETPLSLQVKLLRALEQREIIPVGSVSAIPVDVRIIASTNRNLRKEVEGGRFREDLFYRLNVVELSLPSLAERREDIPLIVEHFVNKFRMLLRKNVKGVENDVMQALTEHEWKGEIRELENIIERGVIFAKGEFVTLEDLPELLTSISPQASIAIDSSLEQALSQFEKGHITDVLRRHKFDKEKTAEVLKISLPTLYRRIKDLGITE
ncbi:MAG TPA: sigma-54 dependent transcriptional regulator [Bacteroidota bacterium]|nr:sigma-54 dependent transcriptional regulator [Bacteroidota bacterium]